MSSRQVRKKDGAGKGEDAVAGNRRPTHPDLMGPFPAGVRSQDAGEQDKEQRPSLKKGAAPKDPHRRSEKDQ
jgi:hypothetical protein